MDGAVWNKIKFNGLMRNIHQSSQNIRKNKFKASVLYISHLVSLSTCTMNNLSSEIKQMMVAINISLIIKELIALFIIQESSMR